MFDLSLQVRLMGGEIKIVDKEVEERGTCFRFNVFLSTTDTIEVNVDDISGDTFQHAELLTCVQSPKPEASQVILFVESAKRSSLLHTYLQTLGIRVHLVNHHQHLSPTLKKIKRKQCLSHYSSSGTSRSDGFASRASSTRSRDVPLSAQDGTDAIVGPSHRRTNARLRFVLIVIDTRAGPFREITRAVAEFRRDLSDTCYSRVVWLDKNNTSFDGLDEDKLPSSDIVISKPFHGFCLYQTIRLLPEFGGQVSHNVGKVEPRRVASVVHEIEEVDETKPLMGKRVLVVDDDPIGRKIATFVASQLGAIVFSSENGEAALRLVCTSLREDARPFDCILMDCEVRRDMFCYTS